MSLIVHITSPGQFAIVYRFQHIEGTIETQALSGESVISISDVKLSFDGGNTFRSDGVTFHYTDTTHPTTWQFNGTIPTDALTGQYFQLIVRASGTVRETDTEFTPPRIRDSVNSGDATIIYFVAAVAPTLTLNPHQNPVGVKNTDLPYHAVLSGTASEGVGNPNVSPSLYFVTKVEYRVGTGPFMPATWVAPNWSADIPLLPGDNSVTIRASDQWASTGSIQDTIFVRQYLMPDPIDPKAKKTIDLQIPTTSSITSWTRLEPQVANADMGGSSNARLFDPLWMMTRQWQVGEFQGEDTGTPVQARVRATTALLTRSRFGEPGASNTATVPYNPMTAPLETLVERRGMRAATYDDLRTLPLRVEAGLRFARMLEQQQFSKYKAAFIFEYPLLPLSYNDGKTYAAADEETRRFVQAMGGRAIDAQRLAAVIRVNPDASLLSILNVLAVAAADQNSVLSTMRAWQAWYDGLFAEPAPSGQDAWTAPRLEYAASVATRLSTTAGDALTLTASEFDGGRLDWTSFDVETSANAIDTSADAVGTPLNARMIPVPVTFPGAPAPRFWEMEDAKVAYGLVPVGQTDLAHLMMIEYASSYGNDWYVVPLDLRVGSVTRVDSLVVTDTFGVQSLLRPIGDPALAAPYFSMWQQSGIRRAGDAIDGSVGGPVRNRFFLPPTISRSVDGPVLEDVLFARDEMANIAWGIEHTIEGGVENVVSLANSASAASDAASGAGAEAGAPPQYLLSSTVPSNWVPLLPVQQYDSNGTTVLTRLRRGAVLLPDGSNTRHTAQSETLKGLGTQLLYEEELPREGVHITRRRRMVRWMDGSSWVWTAYRNDVGAGEGSAGLQFDQLEPPDFGGTPEGALPTITPTLSVPDVVINGASTPYSATLANPGPRRAGVSVQCWITQDTARRAAGGMLVDVGSGAAILPTGTFTVSGSIVATNAGTGTGTLVLGPALFEVELKEGATVLATAIVPVTVVHQPTITDLTLGSSSAYIDGMTTVYTATVENLGPNLANVSLRGRIKQNPTVDRPGGQMTVDCGSGSGVLPNGTFTLSGAVAATNGGSGSGTLVPGSATFELQLLDRNGNALDTRSAPLTLAPNTPTLGAPTLTSTPVIIDGATTAYTTTLTNPGPNLSNVVLQGWLNQGVARRAAGGMQVNVGSASGQLPTGPSVAVSGSISASNSSGGVGTLVPGAATFELQLLVNGTVVQTQFASTTLEPNTPFIPALSLSSSSALIDGPTVGYTATLWNPGASLSNVVLQAFITQGATINKPAGGASVSCGSGAGVLPTGTSTSPGEFLASSSGGGTLVPGAATLLLQLKVNGAIVSSTTVPVTLVTKPTIGAVTPTSSNVPLGGQGVPVTVTIQNPGPALSNVSLTASITQGAANRQAGSILDFGGNHLLLPSGASNGSAQMTASNSNSGSGTLALGAAMLVVSLKQAFVEIATASVPVTLMDIIVLDKPTATVFAGETLALNATVFNADTGVAWSIQQGATGGALSSTAGASTTYTAPVAPGTYQVIATSHADPSKTATCTITVPAVTVALNQTSVTVFAGETLALNATLGNSTRGVTWSATGGSVSPATGTSTTYTAPTAPGTYQVTATSNADTSKKATCTITVPAVTVALNQTSVTVFAGETLALNATLGNSTKGVTWSTTGGSVSPATGTSTTFTAPVASGTYQVTATSNVDTSKKATCTITVPAVTVAISQTSVTVFRNETLALNAIIGNSTKGATWTATGGSVSPATGTSTTYTAPAAPGTYQVTATSNADTSKKATCTITVPPVTISIQPSSSTSVVVGTSVLITATITGTSNHSANWSKDSLSSSVTISPPTGPSATFQSSVGGVFTVTATAAADTSKFASVVISVAAVSGGAGDGSGGPGGIATP